MPILANIIQEAFSPLISLFEAILVFIHSHIVGGSWGLAIVGLTVLVRAIMLPPTYSQFRSMRKMQLLAPDMKALKEKYKDDKQRQNEEMMKLYRENKVNPFASCLPLALQLPVFISLFYMLRTDLKKRICGPALKAHGIVTTKAIEKATCGPYTPHLAKFLFVPDITAKATGVVLVVLLLLYIASQVTSTLLMSASAEPSQRWLMLGLPLVFVVILVRYPAGLLIYWITTNLWTIGQGYFVRRSIGPPPPPANKVASTNASGSPNGRTGAVKGEPALAGVGGASAPPPPPRKKKKRSGRRR
jgi:YidC/Oxa1 family membrane protein insertase